MLIFVSFEVTIVVGSIALVGILVLALCVNFYLVIITVFMKHYYCSKGVQIRIEVRWFQLLVDDEKNHPKMSI